jgi:hypothetical protein
LQCAVHPPPGRRRSSRYGTSEGCRMLSLVKKIPDWLAIIVVSKLVTSYFLLT